MYRCQDEATEPAASRHATRVERVPDRITAELCELLALRAAPFPDEFAELAAQFFLWFRRPRRRSGTLHRRQVRATSRASRGIDASAELRATSRASCASTPGAAGTARPVRRAAVARGARSP